MYIKALALFFTLISSEAFANSVCAAKFDRLNGMLEQTLSSNQNQKPLFFIWKTFRNGRPLEYHGAGSRIFEEGIIAVKTLFGYWKQSHLFSSNLKNNYSSIDPDTSAFYRSLEDEMPHERRSLGIVIDEDSGEVVGTLRLFDGSSKENESNALLPLEESFQRRSISFKTEQFIKTVRHNGNFVAELGQFSLPEPALSERVRRAFEIWILKKYIDKNQDSHFFIHVVTKAHSVLYRRLWNFEVLEEIKIPGKEPEFILHSSGANLKKSILRRIFPEKNID